MAALGQRPHRLFDFVPLIEPVFGKPTIEGDAKSFEVGPHSVEVIADSVLAKRQCRLFGGHRQIEVSLSCLEVSSKIRDVLALVAILRYGDVSPEQLGVAGKNTLTEDVDPAAVVIDVEFALDFVPGGGQ